jgi:transmembrane sensor
MTHRPLHRDEVRRIEASDWVVRLQAADLTEAEALGFDAWLGASAANGAAYDAALAVWREFGAARAALQALPAPMTRRKPLATRRFYLAAGALAAAAAAAIVVLPLVPSAAKTETFVTAKGQHRNLDLADGSHVDLNAGTRLSVNLTRTERRVVMGDGQAVFDVAVDARRPFVIAVGDRTVRVVGTQFDVRNRQGALAVTVARGVVEVHPARGAAGGAYRLRPGQRFESRLGAPEVRVAAAAADDVLGWRAGRLIYRDRPLGEVVADLNQQFSTPILMSDPTLAAIPVSGVLILDNQKAVVDRLALMLPISAIRSDEGWILRRDEVARR